MNATSMKRTVRIFRYDPSVGGEGHFDSYTLDIPAPQTTTILDVLLRIQKEQDESLSFRFACRVNMCGSCGMVINGREGLACKTNVSHLPPKQDITLRPLNHFPIIKDLVVDMGPFFEKYEDTLPFFEPKEQRTEPYAIKPDDPMRVAIGMSTDCIACGCCVSSCTMVNLHEGYAGPAALTRAFTLLADSRDALFEPRLTRALDSCYNCRTEFNCTEVCPKQISGTRAIKFIQRLALKHCKSLKPLEAHPAETRPSVPCPHEEPQPCACHTPVQPEPACASRRAFIMGAVGLGSITVLGGVTGVAAVAPTLEKRPLQWVDVIAEADIPKNAISSFPLNYTRTQGFHSEKVQTTLMVRHDGAGKYICFSNVCPHLGCAVSWDALSNRFKCACHGGAFDRDGAVVAGPPTKPLARLPWKVENGILKVEVA
ncbi:MAG: 2Fe-2S iron-sulfur cluster-binding protein [Desulfovibrionaceae bacterium]